MTEQNSNNSYNNDNNNLFFSQQDISDNNSFRSFNEFANEENNDTNLESSNIFENTKKSRPKYRQDCLRRKLKRLILKYAFIFINEKINDKNLKNSNIKKIGYSQIENVKIKSEKKFIYKTLGDIFSEPISNRHTTIKEKENYNKNKIDKLKKIDTDLKNIFDVTFIQCLNHFMGINNLDILKGMKTFEEIKSKEKKIDKMDEYNLKFISIDYEEIIKRSKPRTVKKKQINSFCIKLDKSNFIES